jgi:phage gp29-like protein
VKSSSAIVPRKRDALGRYVKEIRVRKNGQNRIDAASTMNVPMRYSQIIRPQASYRWMAPGIASFTPRYIETILNGALAGDHVMQFQLFDMMLDTWPVLSTCQQELLYGVVRREMVFDPYVEEDEKPTDEAIEREKVVTAALDNMNPESTLDESSRFGLVNDIMDAWFRGISVSEILWHQFESDTLGVLWGPRATQWAHPQNYGFDSEGRLGLTPQVPPGYATTSTAPLPFGYGSTSERPPNRQPLIAFPPNKFLIAIHKVRSGSALGGSMMRPLAWWWCASNFTSDWLLNLAQIFGLPFRWATYHPSSSDQTVSAICDMLANMGSAAWAAFPEGSQLELKEAQTGMGGHTPQGDLLDRADGYARAMILGQTMTGSTIASGRGGQAFGTVEAQLKQDRLDAACAFVAEVINRQLIPAIITMNYPGPLAHLPNCRFLQESVGTYQDAQRDQILLGLDTPIPISYLHQKYNIPAPTGGEPIAQAPAKPSAPSDISPGPNGTRPIGQSPAQQSPSQTPRQVQARLEELSAIEDLEIFAREFKRFAVEEAQKENQ